MSSFNSDEKLKLLIIEETEKLNECINEWYVKHFPNYLENDFKACCDEGEVKLLIECCNIFTLNNNLQSDDTDVVKALLVYYYNLGVLEHYVSKFIGKKYMYIEKEEPSGQRGNINFTDNYGNIYSYFHERIPKKTILG